MNALYKNEDQVGKIFGPYKVLDFVEYIRDAKYIVYYQNFIKKPPLPEVNTTNPFCEIGDCG